jgi:uncharacterized protein (TIGR02996 family)
MSDKNALHRAVLANPVDDAPRLVYADWLEDQSSRDPFDDWHLATIRQQMANPKLIEPYVPIMHEDKLYTKSHWGEPMQPFLLRIAEQEGWWAWRRGFIYEVYLTHSQVITFSDEICKRVPLESIVVTNKNPRSSHGSLVRWYQNPMYRYIRGIVEQRNWLHPAIFSLLQEGEHVEQISAGNQRHSTREYEGAEAGQTAEKDLSQAALRYARIRAGFEEAHPDWIWADPKSTAELVMVEH